MGISHPAVNSAEWWWGEGACRVGRGGSGRARSSTPLGWSQGAVVASYLCCLVSLSGAAPFQRPPQSPQLSEADLSLKEYLPGGGGGEEMDWNSKQVSHFCSWTLKHFGIVEDPSVCLCGLCFWIWTVLVTKSENTQAHFLSAIK